MSCRPSRFLRVWASVRKRVAKALGLASSPEPPADWGWLEPALVPVGPRPPAPRAAAAALEPPTEPDPLVYPIETDAVGKDKDITL